MNFVTKAFEQLEGRLQSTPFGMAEKILNVLEKENSRTVVADDPQDFVKEGTAGILESPLVSRNAEGLTWEAPAEQIVSGDLSRWNSRKVAGRFLSEILRVSQAGGGIKIR